MRLRHITIALACAAVLPSVQSPAAVQPSAFARWRASGAAAELHIYAKGQHGFATRRQGLPVDGWLDVFDAWLKQQGFVPARATH